MRRRTGRDFFEDPLLYSRQADLARLIAEELEAARRRYLPTRGSIYRDIRLRVPFLPEHLSHAQMASIGAFVGAGNEFTNQQQIYNYLYVMGLL
jgi:hypothetical protein